MRQGDIVYTVVDERTPASVNGEPRTRSSRATQIYGREDGQ